ncbi:hypothetical protein Trydic_g3871 [Trypoxylus dichotomus]
MFKNEMLPTEAALAIVKSRLSRDTTLDGRTSLSVEAIIELLSTCVNTTYFQVDNKFHQQEFGMAMGSPLSSVLSNIYLDEFEGRAMDSYELKPKMLLRYVDDTFVIWPHGEEEINGFLQYLNGLEEYIKDTIIYCFSDRLLKNSQNFHESPISECKHSICVGVHGTHFGRPNRVNQPVTKNASPSHPPSNEEEDLLLCRMQRTGARRTHDVQKKLFHNANVQRMSRSAAIR